MREVGYHNLVLRQHRLLAHSSAGGKARWALLGSMPESYRLNVKVWPGWALFRSSGGEPASGPIQVLVNSVPAVAGLRALVFADCWPGLISAPADLSLVPVLALHSILLILFCHCLEKTLLWGQGKGSRFLWLC